jgi:hypothetical protein
MIRRFSITLLVLSVFVTAISYAQQNLPLKDMRNTPVKQLQRGDEVISTAPTVHKIWNPNSHLSPLVTLANADPLPFITKWDAATNGRSLHTLVRDPSDPMKLHFVAMVLQDNSDEDTTGSTTPSRRVAYTFSSDGGKTWKPQVYVDADLRLGYPDMILYKRGENYVPIIAAHNGPNSANNLNWTTMLYIEQGAPGEGNFKVFASDQNASDGKKKDIGYPSLALSPNQDAVYVVGCVLTNGTITPTNPTQPLEFGTYTLDGNKGATWNGWKNQPGGARKKGHVLNGKDLIRVAPDGKLGVLWSSDSNYVCYVESTDGGNTWTPNYAPLYQAPTKQILASDQKTYDCVFGGCTGGLDFWYDNSSVPHFLWQAYWTAASGTYFPLNSTALFSWKMGDNNVNIISVFNDPAITSLVMFDTLTANVTTSNVVDYFTGSDNATLPNETVLWNATSVVSNDHNHMAVLYSTFVDGVALYDMDINGDGSATETHLFRNIYALKSNDGGQTWGAPEPFAANDPSVDPTLMRDFHFPSTPVFNPGSSNSVLTDVNFYVDSMPGPVNTGEITWVDNQWFHRGFVLLGVHANNNTSNISLTQNYPNPFFTSTTISIVMKNDEMVTISVADMLGREVAVLYHGRLTAGEHMIPFTAPNLGAGIYTYTLKTSEGSISRTMSLVK